ncbi:MAG: hypothetical protein ABSG40_16090 [Terriglobales bacterium]|jgi:hypothetical protein
MIPEFDLNNIPKRFLRVGLIYLDQGETSYGFGVLCEETLANCPQKERELLIDALEKFCTWVRRDSTQQSVQ